MAGNENVNTSAELDVTKMNIFEKLSAISIEITKVNKNLNVGVGKSSYKAVGEADVLAAVKPIEAKYRVYSYPYARKIVESNVIENESVDYSTKERVVKKQLFERMEVTYRFVNMDKADEFVDIVSYGDGIDSADKSVGKAMTYADKYALLKAYKIMTGDDPDQEPSPDNTSNKSNTTTNTNKPKPTIQKVLTQDTIDQVNSLGITLEQIAKSAKVDVKDLNDGLVLPILIKVKAKRAAKKATESEVAAEQTATPKENDTKENDSVVLPDVPKENK